MDHHEKKKRNESCPPRISFSSCQENDYRNFPQFSSKQYRGKKNTKNEKSNELKRKGKR